MEWRESSYDDVRVVEGWFEQALTRSKFSGQDICQELEHIAPDDVDLWVNMAYLFQRQSNRSEAMAAWSKAGEVASEGSECSKVREAAARSWFACYLHTQEREHLELALESIRAAAKMSPVRVDACLLFAYYSEHAGRPRAALWALARALASTDEPELEWGEIHEYSDYYDEDRERLCTVRDYRDLILAFLDHGQFRAAGEALSEALDRGFKIYKQDEVEVI